MENESKREHALTGITRTRLRSLHKGYEKTKKNAEARHVARLAELTADLPDQVRAELMDSGDLPDPQLRGRR